ncbi:TRAP transporter substrate-binding protein [Agrobacterium sp. 22-221-1]|uniref:TRAP transporter substrate-binding protein n=1 Tax=Agrobacterium leguminum TaxID=2792015 RepID=UPI003CE50BF8
MNIHRRQILKVTASFAAGMAMSSLPGFAQGAKRTWDMSDEYNLTGMTGQVSTFFVNEMKKRVGDELEIVYHGGKTLGFRSVDHFDAVQDNSVPLAITQTSQLGGQNALFELTSIPFLVKDLNEARLLWKISKPEFAKLFEDNDMIVLFAVPNAPNGVHSKVPLETVASLKGLRLRTYDAIGTKTFAAAGVSPLQIAFGDLIPQLSTNGIDAVLSSAEAGVQLSLWDYLNTFTALNYVMPLFMAHANKDAYGELSQKARDAFQDVSALTDDYAWTLVNESIESSYTKLEAHKYRVVRTASPEVLAALQKAGEQTKADWLQKMGDRGTKILAAFDAAKA